MSHSQPRNFDTVLGGEKQPESDAAVLGGIAGLERKIDAELKSRHDTQNIDRAEWQLPEPIDPAAEKNRWQNLAQARSKRQLECQFIEPTPDLLDRLTDRGRLDLDRDLQSLSIPRIERNFPWDKMGRIELKTAVILNVYDRVYLHSQERDICLAAIAPARRSDEQIIRLELIDLYPVNHNHRWENCPWLWTEAETPISEWLGTNRYPKTTANDLAMRSLSLLDEGKIEAALGLYGVTLSAELHQLIGGEEIVPLYYAVKVGSAWTNLLVDTLRQSAPWKLPQALIMESE